MVLKASGESLEQAPAPETPCWVQLSSSQMLVKKLNAVQKSASFKELSESLLPFEEAELTGEVVDNTLVAITNTDLDGIRDVVTNAGYLLRGIEFPITPTPHRIGFSRPEKVTYTIRHLGWLLALLLIGLGVIVYHSTLIEKEISGLSQQQSNLANVTPLAIEAPRARGTTSKEVKQILEHLATSLPIDAEVSQIQLDHESGTSYLLVDLEADNALEAIRRISASENIKLVELISSITPALGANRERFRIKVQTIISDFSIGGTG